MPSQRPFSSSSTRTLLIRLSGVIGAPILGAGLAGDGFRDRHGLGYGLGTVLILSPLKEVFDREDMFAFRGVILMIWAGAAWVIAHFNGVAVAFAGLGGYGPSSIFLTENLVFGGHVQPALLSRVHRTCNIRACRRIEESSDDIS